MLLDLRFVRCDEAATTWWPLHKASPTKMVAQRCWLRDETPPNSWAGFVQWLRNAAASIEGNDSTERQPNINVVRANKSISRVFLFTQPYASFIVSYHNPAPIIRMAREYERWEQIGYQIRWRVNVCRLKGQREADGGRSGRADLRSLFWATLN